MAQKQCPESSAHGPLSSSGLCHRFFCLLFPHYAYSLLCRKPAHPLCRRTDLNCKGRAESTDDAHGCARQPVLTCQLPVCSCITSYARTDADLSLLGHLQPNFCLSACKKTDWACGWTIH